MRKVWRQLRENVAIKDGLHYLGGLGCTLVFALFCSGRVGWFLFAAMLVAPFLSISLAWLNARMLTYRVEMEKTQFSLEKPDGAVDIRFFNRMRFNMASIRLVLSCRNGIYFWAENILDGMCSSFTLRGAKEETVQIDFGVYSPGEAFFQVESVEVVDLFHILSFPISCVGEQKGYSIGVVPHIRMLKDHNICNQVIHSAADSEPDEDTIEKSTNQFGGFPGYEHRQYAPGDPVKRINWKLSAKKQELFVRLDEQQGGSGVAVILDPFSNQENLWKLMEQELSSEELQRIKVPNEQNRELLEDLDWMFDDYRLRSFRPCSIRGNAIERALSFVTYFVSNDLAVQFFWKKHSVWQRIVVADQEQVNRLHEELAWANFHEDPLDRVPDELFWDEKCKACIYCTPLADEQLRSIVEDLKQKTQAQVYISAIRSGGKGEGE